MENKLNYSLMNSYYDACATLEAQIIESSLTEDQKKEMYLLIDKALYDAYSLGVDSAKLSWEQQVEIDGKLPSAHRLGGSWSR